VDGHSRDKNFEIRKGDTVPGQVAAFEIPLCQGELRSGLGRYEGAIGRAVVDNVTEGRTGRGVIEQTSLALRMIGAREAVPFLRPKASHPSVQTRMWIFQAIGCLSSKDEVPFLVEHLYEENPASSMSAAQAIEKIIGIDFGIPKRDWPSSPEEGLKNARLWCAAHRSSWRPTSERDSPKR
jgi:hypothetical protein